MRATFAGCPLLVEPLLRVPPFPGSAPSVLGHTAPSRSDIADAEVDQAIDAIARERVAGNFWGQQPPLPETPYILVRVRAEIPRSDILQALPDGHAVLLWCDARVPERTVGSIIRVTGDCDPWHLMSGAVKVIADADDELSVIAAIAGVPVEPVGTGRFREVGAGRAALRSAVRDIALSRTAYASPFTGEAVSFNEAVELCAFWKKLIDANRPIAAALGFAAWKRTTAAPLLWGGAKHAPFVSRAARIQTGDQVIVWKSRTDPATLVELERRGARFVEAEDGFIRSIGLGANCVPPLSLIVDLLGIYFDPRQPSDLETMLEEGKFSPALVARAGRLRELVVDLGVSKYAVGHKPMARRPGGSRHLLVTGQVEDDRSVQCGGGAVTSNLELLRRARKEAADAYIIYKPHPDVEAGHRVGAIAPTIALTYADEIVADQSISSLIDLVDEIHVNTSLAGFEALIRGKQVTTHGVPFYAGWGLTRDLGKVPERRTARLSVDELIAAVLLLYPRYLDPVTGLPCTPEILVRRLAERAEGSRPGLLVRLRRFQGTLRRCIASSRSRTG